MFYVFLSEKPHSTKITRESYFFLVVMLYISSKALRYSSHYNRSYSSRYSVESISQFLLPFTNLLSQYRKLYTNYLHTLYLPFRKASLYKTSQSIVVDTFLQKFHFNSVCFPFANYLTCHPKPSYTIPN